MTIRQRAKFEFSRTIYLVKKYLDLCENDFVLKILDQGEELSLAFFENFKMGPIFVSSSLLHFKKHENGGKKCE